MVVLHAVFIAVVIILTVMGNVMGGVHIDFTVEDVGGRIRCENVGNQRLALFTHGDKALLYELMELLYNEAIRKESSTDKFVRKR